MSFEIVDMNLDERSKYRRMLAGNISNSSSNQRTVESDLIPVPAGAAGSR
jgi:hypothetical protein